MIALNVGPVTVGYDHESIRDDRADWVQQQWGRYFCVSWRRHWITVGANITTWRRLLLVRQ